MIIILEEEIGTYELTEKVIEVYEFYDFRVPAGMQESIFTEAGQLLGSNDASSPVAIPAPTAEGQILFARLAQTTKMLWELVDLSTLVQTEVKTAAYTAINNDHVLVDASGAGADFEIALPATPTAGNKVRVTLVAEHATWKVTIGRNGSLVNGGTSTTALSLVTKGDSVYFEYTGATLGWVTSTLATSINGATEKTTPVDADRFGFWDSVSGLLKHVTWENIKATLKTYFDTLYPNVTVEAGTYTPALTNTTNVASSAAVACQYLRVGSTVTVSGRVQIDVTSAAATVLEISLPVASNFGSVIQCAGVAANLGSVAQESAGIEANTGNNTASMSFLAVYVSNQNWYFTFTYTIIP